MSAWYDWNARPRRVSRSVREIEGCIRRHCEDGAAAAEIAAGGDAGDEVAAARDPPDGALPCPTCCCPGRPARSKNSNAPTTIKKKTSD